MAVGDYVLFGVNSSYTYTPSSGVEILVKELNMSWNYTSNYFLVYGYRGGIGYQSYCPFVGTLYNISRRGPNAHYSDSYDWAWEPYMQASKQSIGVNSSHYLYFNETGTAFAQFRGIITKD